MALEELKTKLTEYEAAVADRETKQAAHESDKEQLQSAIDAEALSRDQWIAALQHEHQVEDEFEALVINHEPPALPS